MTAATLEVAAVIYTMLAEPRTPRPMDTATGESLCPDR
jgi:hypothetical protein